MSSNNTDFNLSIKIYLSKELAERVVAIFLTIVFGLPLSFATAWYVSKQALTIAPSHKNHEHPNLKNNIH
ncbi:hypothetical protein [Gloeothece verrucosa]|nr:hypothetical protein [Gloeothece verrucosa]